MGSGYFWIGIVMPIVTLLVSGYLVWRAVQDHRRLEDDGPWRPRGRGRGSMGLRRRSRRDPREPASKPWESDPDAWKPDEWDSDDDQDGWGPGATSSS